MTLDCLAPSGPARVTRPSLSQSCGQRNGQGSGRAVPGVRGVSALTDGSLRCPPSPPAPRREGGVGAARPGAAAPSPWPFLGSWGDCLAGLPGPPPGGLPPVGRGAGTWLPRYAAAGGRQPRPAAPRSSSSVARHPELGACSSNSQPGTVTVRLCDLRRVPAPLRAACPSPPRRSAVPLTPGGGSEPGERVGHAGASHGAGRGGEQPAASVCLTSLPSLLRFRMKPGSLATGHPAAAGWVGSACRLQGPPAPL